MTPLTVGNLRALLNDKPEHLSQEEWDDLPVMTMNEDAALLVGDVEVSGYSVILGSELCDEEGNPAPLNIPEIRYFGVIAEGLVEMRDEEVDKQKD